MAKQRCSAASPRPRCIKTAIVFEGGEKSEVRSQKSEGRRPGIA
ncbi:MULTISPECIES: hypothetical protein [unclassified Moorena]|nr:MULTISPECIES: hypothetical protein [unclassified Moorena]